MSRLPKIVVTVIGAQGVGKSSLIAALEKKSSGYFKSTTAPHCTTIDNLLIWEIPDDQQYLQLLSLYTNTTHIIALVFDLARPETLTKLQFYISVIASHRKTEAQLILIGIKNKIELQPIGFESKITQFRKEYDLKDEHYMTVSTEEPSKIKEIFELYKPIEILSLLHYKEAFITALSEYKQNRAKRGASIFGFSKQEKISAATKAMACFYGADKVLFSKREKAALKQGSLVGNILKALPENNKNIKLISSLKKTSKLAKLDLNASQDFYKNALIQFLSDYKAIRAAHAKEYYFFKLSGFNKHTKINAVNKLILRLQEKISEPFTDEEKHALKDGALKKTIKTTLNWFNAAPTFEQFIDDYVSENVTFNSLP